MLVLSRLCEPKGIDIALRACRAAGVPLVLAGPVGGLPDRAALDAALADPASPVRGYPDVRWFLEHVAPQLDGDRARWIGSVSGQRRRPTCSGGPGRCCSPSAGRSPAAPRSARRWPPAPRSWRWPGAACPSLVEPGRTGFLADDEAGFTEALGRLGELDPQACAATARRRFSPEVMADGYDKLYVELLHRAAAHPRPAGEEEE